MAQEIEDLVADQGVEEIHIVDDNFNYDLAYAKRVLQELALRKLPIVWKTPNGIWLHAYDEEWFSLLRQTGCYQVGFGIESGAPHILRAVKKPVLLDKVAPILQMYKNNGISTFGYFILGMPGEDRHTASQTIRFGCGLPLDHIHVSLFTPYPGSPLYDRMAAAGNTSKSWDRYYHYLGGEGCELTARELRSMMRRFYIRFYSNPRRALNLLQDIRRSGVRSFLTIVQHYFFSRKETPH